MTRAAKVVLGLALLAFSAACLVAPSKFGATSGRPPKCKRCTPPAPPENERTAEVE